MNQDARLKVTYPGHPKVIKLKRLLGPQAVLSHIFLLLYVAQNKPLGALTNMDETDIEIAANWNDEPGKFVPALLKLRLLDDIDGTLAIHNWENHNPYAFHAKDRSDRAKKAAKARWGKNDTKGNTETCSEHRQAMPAATLGNAPLPLPDPDPLPLPDPDPLNQKSQPASDHGFSKFWGIWPKKVAKADAEKAYKKLKPDDALLAKMISSVEIAKKSKAWLKDKGQWIPNPATWINGKRWNDEIEITVSRHSGFDKKDYAADATPIDKLPWMNS